MKVPIFLPLFAGVLAISACKKEKPEAALPPAGTTLTVEMEAVAASEDSPLILDKTYVNAHGDSISFSAIRYWVSNIVLVKEDNSEVALPGTYFLMENYAAKKREEFNLENAPTGSYKAMKISIGVDSVRNASIDNAAGELSPSVDMSWTWNTGYIFLKAEGKYYNSDSSKYLDWIYHVGTNANYRVVTMNLPGILNMREDKNPKIHIKVDVMKIFGPAPHMVDLKAVPVIMTGPANKSAEVADNYATMFEAHHLHQ